jgi:hypothetical protein
MKSIAYNQISSGRLRELINAIHTHTVPADAIFGGNVCIFCGKNPCIGHRIGSDESIFVNVPEDIVEKIRNRCM